MQHVYLSVRPSVCLYLVRAGVHPPDTALIKSIGPAFSEFSINLLSAQIDFDVDFVSYADKVS